MMRALAGAAALVIGTAAATAAPAQTQAAEARCAALASVDGIKEADRPAAVAACTEASAAKPQDARLLYLKGNAHYWSNQDAEALAAYAAAAERGSIAAVHQTAVMHRFGYGVPEDKTKALALYERALAAGHAPAALDIGRMHSRNELASSDPAKAVAMFRRAVDAGVPGAKLPLGWHYQNGRGVGRDYARAMELYRAAAAEGDADAYGNLGFMAEKALGMPRNPAEAFRLYKLAAEGGSANGMLLLAMAYKNGVGTAKDPAQTETWLRKSVEAGDETGAPNTLAYLYAQENRNLDEAARLAEGALKAAPDDPAVQDTLALVRMRQKRFAEAAMLTRKAIAAKPTQLYFLRLGDIYAAMGLKSDARTAWSRALTAAANENEDSAAVLADARRKLAD